ncbi:WD40 repeat domain-containing protein [Aureimonas fodinaquatilis]|uniref:WD40 repeat domain-containing protein n=1 Tax=Aureimonas fodinaquatilis TaxID=2565783 RepID=A0A5B0DZA0_9HYPH|nr:WD40 repeat domain-containing protein [Aureimonas fodinaquatilis]KAA0972124.1 WD40 repeat domain-containing protein [Aureimonas fodinaquatilis]
MPQIAPYDFDGFVETAAFVKDVPFFALADGTVRRMAGGETVIESNAGGLVCARYDAIGQRLLCGGEDGRVVCVNAAGETTELASAGRKWISAVAGGPGGAVAFAAGRSAYFVRPDGSLAEQDYGRSVEDVAFAPKGVRVAFARYDGVSLWFPGMATPPVSMDWKGAHTAVSFSPDGRFVVTIMQENALHGWRLDDGKHMRMTGYPAKVKSWSWSAKGRFLATSGAPAAIVWPFAGKDGPMGKPPLELGVRGDTMVTCVACHTTDDMVAIGYQDGMILAVRFSDQKEALLRRGGNSPIHSMAWDASGRLLAFGSEGGEAGVVDISS